MIVSKLLSMMLMQAAMLQTVMSQANVMITSAIV
jgi:hypothetical protein